MSTFFATNDVVVKERPYHHGNLREALLEAAVHLIREVGPRGFTLREVARRAGVSHNAPYRHFRDKDELLAAVAAQGFRELKDAMLDAAREQPSALQRLKRAGWAYVGFALRRPEHFTAMFDTTASQAKNPECEEASEGAFGTLVEFIKAAQEEGSIPLEDPQRRALLAWSLVHGVAKLAISGLLPFRSKPEILKFAEYAIDASLPESSEV